MPLAWRLLDTSFRIASGERAGRTAEPCGDAGEALLTVGGDDIAVVPIEPRQAPPSGGLSAETLWRGLVLDHPDASLPARTLARLCAAMDAAAVPLSVASLPGKTVLLFPASLAGRALAAMHQAGVDCITI